MLRASLTPTEESVIIRHCIRSGIAILLVQPFLAFGENIRPWYTNNCQAYVNLLEDLTIWPAICFRAESENQILNSIQEPILDQSRKDIESSAGTVNRLYTGIHLSRSLAIHGKYLHSRHWHWPESTAINRANWESAFLQVGHPILNNLSGAIGLLDLPFGLDFRVGTEAIRALKSDRYWFLHVLAGKMTWIRHDRTTIEMGVASASDQLHIHEIERHKAGPWSLRVSKDIPALEGTKLLFSYARQENKLQNLGFATLNRSRSGSTSFEWVRQIPLDIPGDDFLQILRLNYRSPWIEDKRWYLEYETERSTMWLLAMGYEYLWFREIQLNLEFGYQGRTIEGVNSQWLIGGGLKVNL